MKNFLLLLLLSIPAMIISQTTPSYCNDTPQMYDKSIPPPSRRISLPKFNTKAKATVEYKV